VKKKVVISAAITGAIHTPTMSPHLPITPEQIAGEAVDAAKAGAAEVHIHARDPENGRPSSDLSLFREIVEEIRNRCDAIICLTTGGGQGMSVEERVSVIPVFKPELGSLNMGSINFGMFPLARKYEEWKYSWEKPFLEATRDFIFPNTFADIEKVLRIMKENDTKPELEIYDVGHLYNLLHIMNENEDLIDEPIYLQFVTGILGGIGASIENLVFLKSTADRLFGSNRYHWSALGGGRMQFQICSTAAMLGGGCRVGLEDNLNIEKNVLARSNADGVKKIVNILNQLSMEIASHDEARQMMGLG
jgi:uncharacterized protein (DUF849 family)